MKADRFRINLWPFPGGLFYRWFGWVVWFVSGVVVSGEERFPISTPEEQGIESGAVMELVHALGAEADSIHSLMMVRHGHSIAAGWWAPYRESARHTLYSLSKSFTSTAVGMAIDEGLMGLSDTAVSFFPDLLPEKVSGNLKAMRVKDLLTMSTGHTSEDLSGFSFDVPGSLVKQFLALEVDHKPGTHFLYNTPATYMCSAIVQQVSGQSVHQYLQSRLYGPLGIESPVWDECHDGISLGGYGLNVRTGDIAAFGQTYLQGGRWKGQQIIPENWTSQATALQTSNGSNPNSDWDQGYGFQFWQCRFGGWRGDGAFGQYCLVLPEQDLVIAITSGTNDMQKILNLIWTHLLPGLHEFPLAKDQVKANQLAGQLNSLKLPPVEGMHTTPLSRIIENRKYYSDQSIQMLQIQTTGPGHVVHLKCFGKDYVIPCRPGDWVDTEFPTIYLGAQKAGLSEQVPASVSGAWLNEEVFRLKAWLYQTPFSHTFDMKFSEAGKKLSLSTTLNVAFGPREMPIIEMRSAP